MQYATVTMKGQNAAIKDLARSIQMEYEDNLNAETTARDEYDDADRCIVSRDEVGNGLRMAYFYSTSVYDGLCSDARNGIVLGTLEALRHFIKDLYDIQIEENSEAETEPPMTPFDVVNYRDAEFHVLLEKHSSRLNDHFGPCTSNDVWLQRCKLIGKSKDNSTFKRAVDSTRKLLNVEAWKNVNGETDFPLLGAFVAGTASVSPGTHTVESDFSRLKLAKNMQRRSVTNYALEGELRATQYFEKIKLANNA